MMHPLKQLRRLLTTPTAHQGTVMKVGTDLLIATAHGPLRITPPATDATRYRVGDVVILTHGAIVGRRAAATAVYVR